MTFELHIRFTGQEGDEVPVGDLMDEITYLIETHTNVRVKGAKLIVEGRTLGCQGRDHASRN